MWSYDSLLLIKEQYDTTLIHYCRIAPLIPYVINSVDSKFKAPQRLPRIVNVSPAASWAKVDMQNSAHNKNYMVNTCCQLFSLRIL